MQIQPKQKKKSPSHHPREAQQQVAAPGAPARLPCAVPASPLDSVGTPVLSKRRHVALPDPSWSRETTECRRATSREDDVHGYGARVLWGNAKGVVGSSEVPRANGQTASRWGCQRDWSPRPVMYHPTGGPPPRRKPPYLWVSRCIYVN